MHCPLSVLPLMLSLLERLVSRTPCTPDRMDMNQLCALIRHKVEIKRRNAASGKSGKIVLAFYKGKKVPGAKVKMSSGTLKEPLLNPIPLDRNPWCNGRTIVPASLLVRAEGQPTPL